MNAFFFFLYLDLNFFVLDKFRNKAIIYSFKVESLFISQVVLSTLSLKPQAHILQHEAFVIALRELSVGLPRPKLQFVGSCRNKEDEDKIAKIERQSYTHEGGEAS